MKLVTYVVIGLVLAIYVRPASALDGQEAAADSALEVSLPLGTTSLLSATIAKGRSSRILIMQATIQELGIIPPGDSLRMYPTVNGIGFEPNMSDPIDAAVWKQCRNPFADPVGSGDYPVCTAVGTWWVDLDAVEAAHPGSVILKPLVVELLVETFQGNFATVNATMSVTMDKK